jgi:hypothetical protein
MQFSFLFSFFSELYFEDYVSYILNLTAKGSLPPFFAEDWRNFNPDFSGFSITIKPAWVHLNRSEANGSPYSGEKIRETHFSRMLPSIYPAVTLMLFTFRHDE